VVNIRFLNYKINILGEVTKSGQYFINNDKPTLLDAIGMAGDLTSFGRRDSVIIYREFNGKRELGVVNLNSIEAFNSPYFYLRQNDVIYVMPNSRKMLNADQASQRNIGFATSIISTIAFLVTTIATVSNFGR
jgi:polysaccharide export outer membrane protein